MMMTTLLPRQFKAINSTFSILSSWTSKKLLSIILKLPKAQITVLSNSKQDLLIKMWLSKYKGDNGISLKNLAFKAFFIKAFCNFTSISKSLNSEYDMCSTIYPTFLL